MLALAIGLAGASGCACPLSARLGGFHEDCACNETVPGALAEGTSGFEGPILMQPEGGYVPPLPTQTGPPPLIEPVPQANPFSYTPAGLRRLFGRD
jgi:hypothetical protein